MAEAQSENSQPAKLVISEFQISPKSRLKVPSQIASDSDLRVSDEEDRSGLNILELRREPKKLDVPPDECYTT